MQRLINQIEGQNSWKDCLRKSCKRNGIKTQMASILTPLKIKPLYERLLKTYESNQQKARTIWFENQLKAYHWILIVVSWTDETLIQQFTDKQWLVVQEIFILKELHVLEYEAIRLVNKKEIMNRVWNKQQDQILKSVISSKDSTNKWNDVARTLYEQSNRKYYRSGKQCRQRWLNHLDPNKKRGNWTRQEDIIIAKFILQNGKKWSEMAKRMGDVRTQHMVKNRFKSIVIQYRKDYPGIQQTDILNKVLANSNSKQNQKKVLQEKKYNFSNIQENQNQESPQIQKHNQNIQQKGSFHSTAFKSETHLKHTKQTHESALFSPNSPANIGFSSIQIHQRDAQNENQKNNMFQLKLFSPFCVTFTPQNSVTPLYVSPPPSMPFFMSNFAQSCLRFSSHLNEAQIKGFQPTNDHTQ